MTTLFASTSLPALMLRAATPYSRPLARPKPTWSPIGTCAIINLSYCQPVAAIFRRRYAGSAGWVRAAHAELLRLSSAIP
jgi:hypothetical protein